MRKKINKIRKNILNYSTFIIIGVIFIPAQALAICNLTYETLPLCDSCGTHERCLVEETDYGVCTEVPAGTSSFTLPDGRTVNEGNKVCHLDETDTTSLPCIVRSIGASCDQCSTGTTCYLNGESVGTCTDRDGSRTCVVGAPTPSRNFRIPDLTVRIPGLNFSNIRVTWVDHRPYVDIPWIADYIVSVYRYAVFLGSILSIFLLMIGGIQWLISKGDSAQINAARKRITNAVIGLILIVSSYIILTSINPDLTQLNPLHIPVVENEPYGIKNVAQVSDGDPPTPLELPGQ